MSDIIIFVVGVLFGAGVVLFLSLLRRREAREIARELVTETETEKIQDLEVLMGRVKESFASLSREALRTNADDFLKLAESKIAHHTQTGEKNLESKKQLIDQNLEAMRKDLLQMQSLLSGFEKDRVEKYGELASQLKTAAEQTSRLQETADHLERALASTKSRGQWGERMAEDVLRLAGFIEGINYLKQKALESVSSRPDYTFHLPHGRKVNMDVKFPLSNYLRYLDSEKETERETLKAQFLRDVRARIKEVTTRDYINPEDATLDYVLVFIPNEQVYAFINQNDRALIDDALKSKVILCSPFTLFAILAIIRQAMDNFSLEKTTGDMLKLIGSFNLQWEKFRDSMDKMGKKLDDAQAEFQRLTSTRRNQLEKPLREIENLRRLKGIEPEMALGEASMMTAEQEDESEEET